MSYTAPRRIPTKTKYKCEAQLVLEKGDPFSIYRPSHTPANSRQLVSIIRYCYLTISYIGAMAVQTTSKEDKQTFNKHHRIINRHHLLLYN